MESGNEGDWEQYEDIRYTVAKQSRLRVMRAIGSCRTLREFSLRGRLTSEDLEALLTPLQSSSVLDNIDLFGLILPRSSLKGQLTMSGLVLTLRITGALGDDGIKALSNAVVQKTSFKTSKLQEEWSGEALRY